MYENGVIQDVGGNSKFFTKIFTWMFFGLLITAFTAFALAYTGFAYLFYYFQPLMWIFAIVEVILVICISGSMNGENNSSTRSKILFIVYSIVNGVTLCGIFIAYSPTLVFKAFVGSALMFGVMAFYGSYTKADLSKISSVLLMGLVGVIIMTLANYIFSFFGMYNSMLDVVLGYVTLVIFLGITAWDIQKLKGMQEYANGNDEMLQSMAIYGALSLYLDFVNLFLSLLRITGSRD